jgi:hypothetical protein
MIARMKSGGNHPPQLGKLVNCNRRINSAATVAEEVYEARMPNNSKKSSTANIPKNIPDIGVDRDWLVKT